MPVDFLTEEQERRYGHYTCVPSPAQLTRYFHLDDADRERIAACRGVHNKLGYALQLGTVRFLGTFLINPIDAPAEVIRFLATQLELSETTDLEPYQAGRQHWEHANEIKEAYGYRDFQTQPDLFRLTRWLYTRAWLSAECPIVLFDLTTARLVEHKILLPGVSVLERLVASVRDHAQERLWHVLAQIPTAEQRYLLETLLVVPQGERQTPLDRLRRAPTRITAPALVSALHRIDAVRLLGAHNIDLSFVPAPRIKALARYVLSARVQTVSRMSEDRRIATLLAFASAFEATAHDDALDLFDLLLRTAFSRAQREGQQARLRTLRDLDVAALTLASVGEIILDQTQDPMTLLERIFASVEAPQLQAAVTTVGELTRPPDDNNAQEMLERYTLMRRFLPTLLRTLDFESTQGGQTTLEAVHFLRGIEGHRHPRMHHAPLDVVSRAWRRYVVNREQEVHRPAYTLCVVERLAEALCRHDIFVTPSERWGDPRAKLLQGE